MLAADVVTPQDVGNLLTLVAPGFFAFAAYAYRYPRRDLADLPMLVFSVALSLPIVAPTRAIAPHLGIATTSATHLPYAALLVVFGLTLGTLAGLVRKLAVYSAALKLIGLHTDPAPDVTTAVLSTFEEARHRGVVTFVMKGGGQVTGAPRFWTTDPQAERREVYLLRPRYRAHDRDAWTEPDDTSGVLVGLEDVQLMKTRQLEGGAAKAPGGSARR